MSEHVHEWRYWEQGEFDMWEEGWECVECDANFPTEEIAQRLNATERLSAEDARHYSMYFDGIDALDAYASALEGE